MPNIKSAEKRVLISERNRERNKAWKSAVRTARTQVAEAAQKSTKEALKALQNAYAVIDRAVSKGVLHKNTGARRKARLVKLLSRLNKKAG